MSQHNPFWMSCGPRGIHQECQIILRIDLCPSITCSTRCIPYGGEVLEHHRIVSCVAHKDDPVLWQSNLLGGLQCDIDERHLGHQCLCPSIFELKGQLIGGIAWICGREYSSGPMASPCYRWSIYAIGREQGEDVVFLPIPE